MKIVKEGEPELVDKIKTERQEQLEPLIKCEGCDAEFRIIAGDCRSWSKFSPYQSTTTSTILPTIAYVDCPCCESELSISGSQIPSDFVTYPIITINGDNKKPFQPFQPLDNQWAPPYTITTTTSNGVTDRFTK